MIGHHVAKRYAKAIYELAEESQSLEQMVREVNAFSELYATNHELRAALGSPLVSLSSKREIIKTLASRLPLSNTCTHALLLLADRRRLSLITVIARIIRELSDLRRGV